MKWIFVLLISGSILGSACTTHIAPYRAKKRQYRVPDYPAPVTSMQGSILAPGTRGFFEDDTASRVGDVLVVIINEQESATRNASTKLAKKNETAYSVGSALGLMAKLKEKFPDLDPAALFASSRSKSFDGTGAVARNGTLTATLPVRIRKVLPNGDFFVEGTKVVMVGSEEHHIYVSGVVRYADVSADNTVLSSRIADAEIEYTGRGDVSDQQREGWFARVLSKIWPF